MSFPRRKDYSIKVEERIAEKGKISEQFIDQLKRHSPHEEFEFLQTVNKGKDGGWRWTVSSKRT